MLSRFERRAVFKGPFAWPGAVKGTAMNVRLQRSTLYIRLMGLPPGTVSDPRTLYGGGGLSVGKLMQSWKNFGKSGRSPGITGLNQRRERTWELFFVGCSIRKMDSLVAVPDFRQRLNILPVSPAGHALPAGLENDTKLSVGLPTELLDRVDVDNG